MLIYLCLVPMLIALVVLGAGLGMMSSTVPVWQSETSKVHKRGHHVIVDGICIAAGIAMSSWLTFGFSQIDTDSSYNWRLPRWVRLKILLAEFSG